NAVRTTLGAMIALDLVSYFALDSGLDSFTWWANALVFFATLTFITVNVANVLYFWRCRAGEFRLGRNLFLPAAGILSNAYLIYAAFFSALWETNWRVGKSVVVACLCLLAVQLGVSIYLWRSRPELFTQSAPLGAECS